MIKSNVLCVVVAVITVLYHIVYIKRALKLQANIYENFKYINYKHVLLHSFCKHISKFTITCQQLKCNFQAAHKNIISPFSFTLTLFMHILEQSVCSHNLLNSTSCEILIRKMNFCILLPIHFVLVMLAAALGPN